MRNMAAAVTAIAYAIPRMRKVVNRLVELIRLFAAGAVITAPPPKPATAMPVITPRLSENHLISVVIGTM